MRGKDNKRYRREVHRDARADGGDASVGKAGKPCRNDAGLFVRAPRGVADIYTFGHAVAEARRQHAKDILGISSARGGVPTRLGRGQSEACDALSYSVDAAVVFEKRRYLRRARRGYNG